MKGENDNKTVDWVDFQVGDFVVVGLVNALFRVVQNGNLIFLKHEKTEREFRFPPSGLCRKAKPEEIKTGKRLGDQP